MKNSIVRDYARAAITVPVRFEVKATDYHAFEEAKFFFRQMGVKVNFKETGLKGTVYVAQFEIVGVY